MQSRDYLERMIQKLAAAIARVSGFTAAAQWDEAERELDEAWAALGLKRSDVRRLDGSTLRSLLGAKAPHAIALLEAEIALARAIEGGPDDPAGPRALLFHDKLRVLRS